MRRLTRTLVLLLVALLVVGAAPVAAGGSHGMKASFATDTFPPILDPDVVAERCPAGSQWIWGGFGTGTMTSAVYTGDFTYENTHCSRWIAFDPERSTGRQVGKTAAGLAVITTPEGELWLEYAGTWVLRGDVTTLDFTADLHLRYTITGGTGVFTDASGHGRYLATGGIALTNLLNGSLIPG